MLNPQNGPVSKITTKIGKDSYLIPEGNGQNHFRLSFETFMNLETQKRKKTSLHNLSLAERKKSDWPDKNLFRLKGETLIGCSNLLLQFEISFQSGLFL